MAHVPLVVDLVRGLEDPGRSLGHARDAVERAAPGDLPHERVGVEALFLGDALERLVHKGQHPLAVGLPHAVLEGEREDRLDAR